MAGNKTLIPLLASVAIASWTAVAHAAPGATRTYWIAADEVVWDYAPSFPTNLMTGEAFTEPQRVFVEEGIGRKYLKALYREYTPQWQAAVERSPEERLLLGTLGPILRAEVGDTLVVHFRNNTRFPVSMHPHGVFYDKGSEGAPYEDDTDLKADDAVAPGDTHTYVWPVPRRAGPGPNDPSSIAWIYHSHTDEPADTNAGLIGPIIITAKGGARADATPKDVDREFVSLFSVFDENASPYLDVNQAACSSGPCDPEDEGFQESNLMHGINGLLWGNNRGYTMRVGERVRWYIIAMGTEVDLHTPHWHGVTLLHNGHRLDVAEVLPAATKTFDLEADNAGTWMFHCHVNDHLEAGMMTTFTILP
jgi:FtsP/CotA-like multicopper oxidase with cupredoxin domain